MNLTDLFAHGNGYQIEQYCRTHARSAYVGAGRAICRVLGDRMMMVDTADLSVAPHLMLDGFWEMSVSIALGRHVKPGMRCADVGAHLGYFTVLMGTIAGSTGHVQAWEPQPRLARCLRASIALNGLNAVVVPLAADSADRTSTLQVPRDFTGSAALRDPGMPVDERIEVGTAPLAQVWSGAPPDVVKIDAEGHEPEVWQGLVPLLHDRLVAVVEFAPQRYDDPAAFLDRLAADGFGRLREVRDDGILAELSRADALATADFRMLWLARG